MDTQRSFFVFPNRRQRETGVGWLQVHFLEQLTEKAYLWGRHLVPSRGIWEDLEVQSLPDQKISPFREVMVQGIHLQVSSVHWLRLQKVHERDDCP